MKSETISQYSRVFSPFEVYIKKDRQKVVRGSFPFNFRYYACRVRWVLLFIPVKTLKTSF